MTFNDFIYNFVFIKLYNMNISKSKDDSYIKRRDFLLQRIRLENWEAKEEKPRRKIVQYVNKKPKK